MNLNFPLKILFLYKQYLKFRCWFELKLNILKHNHFNMIGLDKERLREPLW